MADALSLSAEEEASSRKLAVLGITWDGIVVARLFATLDAARAETEVQREAKNYAAQHRDRALVERDAARAERDEARGRCRVATQAIVDAIGAVGPESLEHAVARLAEALFCAQRRSTEHAQDLYSSKVNASRGYAELAALRALADAVEARNRHSMSVCEVALAAVRAAQGPR